MEKSIFEKIADKEITSYIVNETEDFMAILDINPATYGQVLALPKKWHDSYLFNNDDEFIQKFIIYVKSIARLLDEKLGSNRCRLLFEGLGVDHLHAKLYPIMNIEEIKDQKEGFDFNARVEFNDKVANEILSKIHS